LTTKSSSTNATSNAGVSSFLSNKENRCDGQVKPLE